VTERVRAIGNPNAGDSEQASRLKGAFLKFIGNKWVTAVRCFDSSLQSAEGVTV
jgi:hypothetical protein